MAGTSLRWNFAFLNARPIRILAGIIIIGVMHSEETRRRFGDAANERHSREFIKLFRNGTRNISRPRNLARR